MCAESQPRKSLTARASPFLPAPPPPPPKPLKSGDLASPKQETLIALVALYDRRGASIFNPIFRAEIKGVGGLGRVSRHSDSPGRTPAEPRSVTVRCHRGHTARPAAPTRGHPQVRRFRLPNHDNMVQLLDARAIFTSRGLKGLGEGITISEASNSQALRCIPLDPSKTQIARQDNSGTSRHSTLQPKLLGTWCSPAKKSLASRSYDPTGRLRG